MKARELTLEKSRPRAPGAAQAITVFAFLLLYVPLVTLVVGSFLAPELDGGGWTLEWYRKVFYNGDILKALSMSFWVGAWSTLISTIVGTAAALALERNRFPGRRWLDALTHVPLIMPEIVLGLSLLIWFVLLRITLGSLSIVLAHVTFTVSYVIITVRARLKGFDRSLEEAGRDLGATPWRAFWRITFPLIRPGILSGALIAFTLSFDDFLITFFTAGVDSDTLPVRIYSMIKFGVSPEINALSTLMLTATVLVVSVSFRRSPR